MLKLSKDELNAWLDLATTEKIYELIVDKRQQYANLLLDGGTLGANVAQETARIVGIIAGLDIALNIEIEDDDA